MNGSIPDPWRWGNVRIGADRPEDLDPDVAAALARPGTDPATTAELAVQGHQVGAASDVLRVATFIRCRKRGDLLGAVLWLDRGARELSGLWLAEVVQRDLDTATFERGLSATSRTGQTTDGTRLAECDAVIIPQPPAVTLASRVEVTCVNWGHGAHYLGVAELIDAGRHGLIKRKADDTPRHVLHADGVQR